MSNFDFDLIVIGGGSGGVRAARISAGHGARVAICEEYRYGGTCVIRGCVPKKMFVYASQFHEEFIDSAAFGWNINVKGFDWPTLIKNKDKEIDRLNEIYGKLLENAGCQVFNGRGELLDKNTVKIGNQTYTSERILIATGGTPFLPTIAGIEHAITSNEAFYLDKLPKSIVIVGGGYIAVEFAGIFNGLGVDTTLVYRGKQILRGFDQDIADHLSEEIVKKGINLKLNSDIQTISKTADSKILTYQDGTTQTVSEVMYATGRTPNTENIGLEKVGVQLGKRNEILINKELQTNIDTIFAVGDVTDRIALTPVATMEGHAFADSVYANNPTTPDYENVPSAVFSQPPVASVGLSQEQALEKFDSVDIYKSDFRILKHTLTDNAERTLMKLVVEPISNKVIGAHMVGHDAAEIMQGIAIAIKVGATKADFDATVGIHPSSAEEFCTMRTKSN